MNKFFPVGSATVTATSAALAATALPSGGPNLRISRETGSVLCYIKFGTGSVAATTDGMELVSGVVEELELPSTTTYTHFSVITASGTCKVNISAGPRYDSK